MPLILLDFTSGLGKALFRAEWGQVRQGITTGDWKKALLSGAGGFVSGGRGGGPVNDGASGLATGGWFSGLGGVVSGAKVTGNDFIDSMLGGAVGGSRAGPAGMAVGALAGYASAAVSGIINYEPSPEPSYTPEQYYYQQNFRLP